MYKIIENNQIIDVVEDIKFVKFLPKSKRAITVGEKEANGVLSSNNSTIYHIYGTPNTFDEEKKEITYQEIDLEEFERLTQQMKVNQSLEKRLADLEKLVEDLRAQLNKKS